VVKRPSEDVTQLLLAWQAGDEGALERLIPLVHDELHQIADRCMRRERDAHTLQATGLVNEAYMRLIDAHRVQWQDRTHFLALSARVMPQVLVDYARRRNNQKRGGGVIPVTLIDALDASDERPYDVIALDDALEALRAFDARKSQVVEMRFFGGLSIEETAHALRVSPQTVMRDWNLAKKWLSRELTRTSTG
jgi:RNA polymerase sigma-70 factor (ECF subfamily)